MNKKKDYFSLFLINPINEYNNLWALKEVGLLMNKKATTTPLALPTLAAMTPEHYKIRIIDEEIGPIPFKLKPDIVGITAMATNVKRAYEIADKFRSAGITVVMGGPYTTLSYTESLGHSDAVVVGEAEGVWEELLSDFENNRLKKIYQTDKIPDISTMPIPRWDLVNVNKILTLNVQISRGCPNACDFCCVSKMYGRKQRYRDIDNVIEEIKSLPIKQLSFVDDNLTMNKAYARELMKRLKPLDVTWFCLASVDVANDEELLKSMAEAGCCSILVGFETLNEKNLAEAHKSQYKIKGYEDAVKKIHSVGIHVIGAFIVGFDEDTIEVFEHIKDFTLKNNISYVMLNILTVFYGTKLYSRMKMTERYIDLNPEFLNGIFPSMKYKNMSAREVFDKYFETLDSLYSYENLYEKAVNIFNNGCFNRPRKGGVRLIEKIRGTILIFKNFVFTSDVYKRKLFLELIDLYKGGVAHIEIIVEYLFFIMAARKYIDNYKLNKEKIYLEFLTRNKFN